jgi:predicted GTPase
MQNSQVLAAETDCRLIGPTDHAQSSKPLVSIGAVRTGAGKSQTTRRVADALRELGYKVVAVRIHAVWRPDEAGCPAVWQL